MEINNTTVMITITAITSIASFHRPDENLQWVLALFGKKGENQLTEYAGFEQASSNMNPWREEFTEWIAATRQSTVRHITAPQSAYSATAGFSARPSSLPLGTHLTWQKSIHVDGPQT